MQMTDSNAPDENPETPDSVSDQVADTSAEMKDLREADTSSDVANTKSEMRSVNLSREPPTPPRTNNDASRSED